MAADETVVVRLQALSAARQLVEASSATYTVAEILLAADKVYDWITKDE